MSPYILHNMAKDLDVELIINENYENYSINFTLIGKLEFCEYFKMILDNYKPAGLYYNYAIMGF